MTIFVIKKDGSGGILEYDQSAWEKNTNAKAEYREARKEELEKYFNVVPVLEEETQIDDIMPDPYDDGNMNFIVETQLDEDVTTKKISKSKKIT